MTIAEAQAYMKGSNDGSITWDDHGRNAADKVLSGSKPNIPSISMDDVGGSAVDFAKGLGTLESNALGEYTKAIQGQASPLDIYKGLQQEAGVPQLRKVSSTLQGQINNVEDTIKRAEQNVASRTKNSLVTQGQRDGMIESVRRPLREDLAGFSTDLGRVQNAISQAMSDVATMTGLAVQGQDRQLRPFEMNMQLVMNQAARLMTGFTADRQTKLDALMFKYNRQFQLEDREWQEAQQLLAEERSFNQQKELLEMDTQVITADGRQKLVNTRTGEVIADLGSSTSGGSGGGDIPFGGGSSPWSIVSSNTTGEGFSNYEGLGDDFIFDDINWSQYGL